MSDPNARAAELFDDANQLLSDGDLNSAILKFRDARDILLESGETERAGICSLNVGGLLEEVGEFAEARSELSAALDRLGGEFDDLAHEIRLTLGLVAERTGDIEAAKVHYSDITAAADRFSAVYALALVNLAGANRQTDMGDEAILQYRAAIPLLVDLGLDEEAAECEQDLMTLLSDG